MFPCSLLSASQGVVGQWVGRRLGYHALLPCGPDGVVLGVVIVGGSTYPLVCAGSLPVGEWSCIAPRHLMGVGGRI